MVQEKNIIKILPQKAEFLEEEKDSDTPKIIHSMVNKKTMSSAITQEKLKSYYVLAMFPYPSGNMHMGHVRNYTIGDAIARFKRMEGYNVIHPMGWDAFGLPAENAAIEKNIHPKKWTLENISAMKQQMHDLSLSYDWHREITTCNSDYFGLEQMIFIEFFNKNIAYQKESYVNWDPVDNTVLANEQVIEGKGWRSGATVEKKKLKQWYLKITDYAEDLLDSLETLDDWPEAVKSMQKKWIGKSIGAEISFELDRIDDILSVFTTRPDTIFGASFCAIALDHPIAQKLSQTNRNLLDFITKHNQQSISESSIEQAEKNGIDTGIKCKHPFIEGKYIPLFIANFVLIDYGLGAVFGCPAHDSRDFDFATKYKLEITPIIKPLSTEETTLPYTQKEGKLYNSGFLNDLSINEAKEKVIDMIEQKKIGKRTIKYRLKDWGISRQRYWGCPIPIVYCDDCGTVALNKEDLPLKLPEDVSFTGQGNPLDHHPSWKHTLCPQCRQPAIRETDTFDTFFESSWYFFRFIDPNLYGKPFDRQLSNKLLPVNQYIGGIEHATMHLLYARFFTKALNFCQFTDVTEPFQKLLTQGMVCNKTYKNSVTNNWVSIDDVINTDGKLIDKNDQNLVIEGRSEKMSKSKKNGVSPIEIITKYNSDTARMFMLSDSPPEKNLEWSNAGVEGCFKFLNKLETLIADFAKDIKIENIITHTIDVNQLNPKNLNLYKEIHKTIFQTINAYNQLQFNKVIAHIRKLCNEIIEIQHEHHTQNLKILAIDETIVIYESLKVISQLLSPIAPDTCEKLLKILKHDSDNKLPIYNQDLIQEDHVVVAIQICGKLRTTIKVLRDLSQEKIMDKTKNMLILEKHLKGKEIIKVIYIQNKVLNIVVK